MKNLLNTQQKLLKQQQQSSALIGVHPNCFAHLARISKRNIFFWSCYEIDSSFN